jgi:hypothetical protein
MKADIHTCCCTHVLIPSAWCYSGLGILNVLRHHLCCLYALPALPPQLEELPGGYQTKSLMALPVMLPRDASGAAALTAAQNAAAAEAVHQARDHAGSAVALGYQPGAGNGSSQPGYAHTQPSPTRQSQAASTGGVGPAGGFILGSQGTDMALDRTCNTLATLSLFFVCP